jgi:hypothetical protein
MRLGERFERKGMQSTEKRRTCGAKAVKNGNYVRKAKKKRKEDETRLRGCMRVSPLPAFCNYSNV